MAVQRSESRLDGCISKSFMSAATLKLTGGAIIDDAGIYGSTKICAQLTVAIIFIARCRCYSLYKAVSNPIVKLVDK